MKIQFRNALAWSAIACLGLGNAVRADAVLDWNIIAMDALAGQNPVNETRLAAITHLAVFDAVNTITGKYRPYLAGLDPAQGASPEAAAIAAAHRVLIEFLPGRAAELDTARASSLAAIPDGPAKEAGLIVGVEAAEAMIEARVGDGSTPLENFLPTTDTPGAWQLTNGCPPQGGVFLNWRSVTPFGIRRGSQFRAAPPPKLKSWAYAVAFNEVKRVGGTNSTHRPQDRADVARYYAAVLAIRTWNPAARQVAAAQGRSLAENARAFALLNMALNDALIAVFDTKYHTPFWRPETSIPAGDRDGNFLTRADPDFVPFIATPCHPSYASAHASAAYAAVAVLEHLYGSRGHFIVLESPLVPGVRLEYSRFEQIATDIDDARVYGGIHYRFDQEAGARQGCQVGEYIYRHNLRRRYAHGDSEFADWHSGRSRKTC